MIFAVFFHDLGDVVSISILLGILLLESIPLNWLLPGNKKAGYCLQ